MFHPRKTETHPGWSDPDGIKLYTISAHHQPVEKAPYLAQLAKLKQQQPIAWSSTPAFAIFHDGATLKYLVLAWWGNDNELFTSVSVQTPAGWVEDPARYSFCAYDLEVMWQERNFFIECLDCAAPDLAAYRARRWSQPAEGRAPL